MSWKMANKWFLDYLKQVKSELDQQITAHGLGIITCDQDLIDQKRRHASALAGQVYTIDTILDLENHYPVEEK